MPPDLKTWTCVQCQRTILVPWEDIDARRDAYARIREHRLGHTAETLMQASDGDLWGMCGDEPGGAATASLENISAAMQMVRDPGSAPPDPVDSDDLAPVLAGIEGLLRDDLPRARRLWYPIRDDGSFNREEDK